MLFQSSKAWIIRCRSADEIFRHLQFGSSILAGGSYGEIGFRGQTDASWPLDPTAFRRQSTLGYSQNPIRGRQPDIGLQVPAEILSIREFAERADRIGLDVPGPFHEFRSDPHRGDADPLTIKEWPKTEDYEIVAIGQHHGVPTRLLDFSYEPLTAGFFATMDSFRRHFARRTERQCPDAKSSKSFAIWIVDLRMIQTAWKEMAEPNRRRVLPRVREVRVPRASNEFLHEQHGFFLLDLGANDLIVNGRYEDMEEVIHRFSAEWGRLDDKYRRSHRLRRRRLDLLSNPVIKLVGNWALAGNLMKILNRQGISLPNLMPDYDHVVHGLELERQLKVETK